MQTARSREPWRRGGPIAASDAESAFLFEHGCMGSPRATASLDADTLRGHDLRPLGAPHHYSNHTMKYECLLDTWRSILVFRISRYVTHFGAALVVWSVALVAILWRAAAA